MFQMVHSSAHLAAVKQRREQQEELRAQHLEHVSSKASAIKLDRLSDKYQLRQARELEKHKKVEKRREDLANVQQQQLKFELQNKQAKEEARLQETLQAKALKCKKLGRKNEYLQNCSKERRVAREEAEREVTENQLAYKEIRTLQNLGIKPKSKTRRQKYTPQPREEPTDVTKILFQQLMEFTALLETAQDVHSNEASDNNLFVAEEQRTRDWINSGFDNQVLDPKYNQDDFITEIRKENQNRFIEPLTQMLHDLNIDTDCHTISKQLVFYADYLRHLNTRSGDAGDQVDWPKWKDEVEGRVRPIPDWQIRALEQNRVERNACEDQ